MPTREQAATSSASAVPRLCPLKAIVGPGRSGTTWVGTLVDSCSDVIYRFEPFHRLSAINTEIREWFEKLKRQEVTEQDVPRIYSLLCTADPLTNKAPFFEEKSYPVRSLGRAGIWPLARMLPAARWLYKAAYSPDPGPPLVFKEVTFVRQLENLLERTTVPVVYLIRHPCATVLSGIHVQARDGLPPRVKRLREILDEQAPTLAARFADIVNGDDVVSKTALLWRCEVEQCVTRVRGSVRGLVITYEQLADDAHAHARAIFAHLGITYGNQTDRYIDGLYSLPTSGRIRTLRTGWSGKDFSVYRNPREQKDSWKTRISTDDRRRIEAIVQGSPVIESCAAQGRWW